MFEPGHWLWSIEHRQPCKVVEASCLWDDAAYPFVGSVGETLGRLLKLQHEAHHTDIQRRLREQHGDRVFVSRITRYDVSSFLDWGAIADTKKAGVYLPGKQVTLGTPTNWPG